MSVYIFKLPSFLTAFSNLRQIQKEIDEILSPAQIYIDNYIDAELEHNDNFEPIEDQDIDAIQDEGVYSYVYGVLDHYKVSKGTLNYMKRMLDMEDRKHLNCLQTKIERDVEILVCFIKQSLYNN